jgi:hypothetical protein
MPLDDLARRSWPGPDPDALLKRVLASSLFRQGCIELVEAALNAADIHSGPVSREQFAVIAQRPELQRRMQAAF